MKKITIKCNEKSCVEEVTLWRLPDVSDVDSLAHILYKAKSTDGFEEILNAISESMNEEHFAPLAKAMILTGMLTKELYEFVYDIFMNYNSIENMLILTIYSDNPVPEHIYEEILKKQKESNEYVGMFD